MKQLKIIDKTFAHSILGYCSDYQTCDEFKWDRELTSNDYDVVVYTDMVLNQNRNPNNVAWLIEPIDIAPQNYKLIRKLSGNYKTVFTHEKTLLDLGEPYEFVPFGCCWINKKDHKIYSKNKLVSIIASKKLMTNGHKLRHDTINSIKDKIDVFGRGWNPIDYKLDGLKDYRFSIVIENTKRDYWFTEKLIDCLVTGTIPIYYGCPSIGNFFNKKGFIIVDNLSDIKNAVNKLTPEQYEEMKPYVLENFDKAKNYLLPDKHIFNNINYGYREKK